MIVSKRERERKTQAAHKREGGGKWKRRTDENLMLSFAYLIGLYCFFKSILFSSSSPSRSINASNYDDKMYFGEEKKETHRKICYTCE
jgi:hypothetical protein